MPKCRILAQAVSWAFRPDNWRFLPWYLYLKEEDRLFVDEHFDDFLNLELKEMSIDKNSDISHLIAMFNLPQIEQIHSFKNLAKASKRQQRNYRIVANRRYIAFRKRQWLRKQKHMS